MYLNLNSFVRNWPFRCFWAMGHLPTKSGPHSAGFVGICPGLPGKMSLRPAFVGKRPFRPRFVGIWLGLRWKMALSAGFVGFWPIFQPRALIPTNARPSLKMAISAASGQLRRQGLYHRVEELFWGCIMGFKGYSGFMGLCHRV